MASTKSTASTTISSGDFVKIDGKGIAFVKQQACRDGAVMYIVQVCGCDFDVEIDAKRVQTVTADSGSPSQVYLICYQNVLELFHAAHEVLCCILLKIMFIKCYVYLELYFVCVVFSCLT